MSAAATEVASNTSSQHPLPPLTADSVLRRATRDPSNATALLPDLRPEALDDLLSSLTAASPANHLALLPRLLSLSPSPAAAATFFSALLSAPSWPSATLLAVASLLRDLPPAYRTRVPAFLTKIISLLPSADAQDLPALAYQLLLIASKPLHPRVVLTGLLRFFGGHSGARVRAPPSIARQIEGTVLMHVAFAVKQDPALAREVLAAVKSDAAGALSGFAVAVLLFVARVRRFNEGAVGVLRDAVVLSRRDYRLSRRCKWMPNCLKEEYARAAQCIEKALLKAVHASNGGREEVVPSIVQVGFLLLEVSGGDRGEEDGSDKEVMNTEDIGVSMLKSLFEIHEMARTEIIEKCKFRILSAKPQRNAQIFRLLGSLIRSHPIPMLQYIAHLKELLDYFSFMNDKISSGLISCILPLTIMSRDLKDYIILVVRKAMFKREDMVRVAAANAIIDLIITENRKNGNSFEESSSQPSSSQHPEMHLEFSGGLFHELSGLLRRCFSQQANVKEVLYEGLKQIVISDPAVADSVLDFLWPHFQKYYIEDAERPLKIESCFKVEDAKLYIVEPLDCLLSCISSILRVQQITKCEQSRDAQWNCFDIAPSQDNEAGRSLSRELFMKALSSIQKYLSRPFTEDQQGQSQDAGSLSSSSEMSHFHNFVMLRIIEVFVEFAASKLDKATGESKEMIEKEILELIGAYSGFERKTSNGREKIARRRGNASDNTDKHTNESIDNSNAFMQKIHEKRGRFVDSNLYQLVILCVKQCNADSSNRCSQRLSQTKWNQGSSLVSLVLKACLELFKSLAAKESGDIIRNMRAMQDEDVKKLMQPIMQLIWCLILDSVQENGGVKRNMAQGKKHSENKKDQLYLALACLKELLKPSDSGDDIIEVMISSAPPNLESLIDAGEHLDRNDAAMVEDESTRNAHVLLNILRKLYARILSQSPLRECEVVSELILSMSRKLHPEQRYLVGSWAADLCKMESVQSPSIAREVVKLAIHLAPAPDDMFLLYEMAGELEKSMASGDEGSTDTSDTFHIINCKTIKPLAAVFLQLVESSLTELEWGLGKLKAMLTIGYDVANINGDQPADERMQRLDLEEALYSRSGLVVHVLSTFATMSLKDTQAEQFLKLTAKFYKLLTRMSKSQIAPKGYTQSIPGLQFQKLAELTCRKLTGPIYAFVSSEQKLHNLQTSKKGGLAKIRRESKCIPDLIFQIEDYEKYLIQLSKLTKVNLLRHAKRSVARDFQIKPKEKSGEEQQEEDGITSCDASSGNDPDEDAEGPNPPTEATANEEDEEISAPRKRAKTNQIVQDSDEEAEDE